MAAAEELFECELKIFIDLVECFFELLPRKCVYFFDCGVRVLDRLQEVFSLGFEECLPLGGFLIFLERHHIDRAHSV